MINAMTSIMIKHFPFLDGDVPLRPSYAVYISQFLRFARVCSHEDDCNARNKCLTSILLSKGYRRHYELFSKFNVGLKSLLHQPLPEPEFYDDL